MPPVLPLMKKPARLCLAAGTLFALFLTPLAQGRTWTNHQGKKLEAEFIRLDGQKAVLKRSGGQTVSIPLSLLSREDRDFIAEQEKGRALPTNTADAKARRASSWGQRGQGTAEEFWFRSIPWESKPWEAHTSLTVTRTPPPSSMN